MNKMRDQKRGARLDDLRARIERGTYEVKPDRVAEAMIRRGVVFTARRPGPRG